jgi:ParB-like chromosome segregation protein Spo0J
MTETTNEYQVLPPLSDEEYQALKEDMAENGMLVPVVQDTAGNIIDGHHRVRA